MQFQIAIACLFLSITFCVSLFHFVPILSKSKNRYKNDLVSDYELKNISQSLFNDDKQDFLSQTKINYQGFLNFSNFNDLAPSALLTINDAINKYETVKRMKKLYDNFEVNSSIDETVTLEEETEEMEFIDCLLETSVMKQTMEFLSSKGFVSSNAKDQYKLIHRLWFEFYPRNKNKSATSSGFEHVFLAESKKGKIIGLHNWIYFAEAEKNGKLDYKGWMKHADLGNKAKMVKLRFDLNGLKKPLSSFFIGTSPEIEISLFTICFLARPNRGCRMAYDGIPFTILTHSLSNKGNTHVASAYLNL